MSQVSIRDISYKMVVYLVTNLVNGKVYVGKTTFGIRKRWKRHLRDVNIGSALLFHRAIRKHGKESFDISIIANSDSRHAVSHLERLWIIALRSYDPTIGYNMTRGGDGFSGGYRRSPETYKKIAAKLKGKPLSVEHCEKLSIAKTNPSNTTREKMRHAKLGIRQSAETRHKRSQSMMGHRGWNKGRKRPPSEVEKIRNAVQSRAREVNAKREATPCDICGLDHTCIKCLRGENCRYLCAKNYAIRNGLPVPEPSDRLKVFRDQFGNPNYKRRNREVPNGRK